MTDIDWQNARGAADVVRGASDDLDHTLASGSPGNADIAEVARVLVDLQYAQGVLAHCAAEVHAWLADLMEDNDQHIDGFGDLHRDWKRSSRSAWESERLLDDALRAARARYQPDVVDPETGERQHSWSQAVHALRSLYNLAGYNARVSGLRALDLSTGDYCVEGKWVPKVTITEDGSTHDSD